MSDDQVQDQLEQAVVDAGQTYEANPTPENYAAHVAAHDVLCEHRASKRSSSGPAIGGSAAVGKVGE